MPKTRAKTIKGLSIACIILSALYMLAFVIGGVAIGALVEYYDPIMDSIRSNVSSGQYGFSYDLHSYSHAFDEPHYGYGFDYYDDIIDSAYLLPILQFGMVAIIVCFIMQAVSLVAGIIMLINSSKPQKLGMSFGWGLAGAILSALSGGIVQTVLFVLAIVFIYKDQQLYKAGQYPMSYQQPPVQAGPATAGPVAGQNVPAQPPAPNARPAQPQQVPVVPAAPAQVQQPTEVAQGVQQVHDAQLVQGAQPVQDAQPPQNAPQAMDPQSADTVQFADEILDPPVVEETEEIVEVSGMGEDPFQHDSENKGDEQA